MKMAAGNILCVISVIFLHCSACAAPPEGSGYSWKLVFGDEFEGVSIDRSKWITQHPWGRTFKGQAYNRDENVTVNNGILTITAKAESYGGKSFTSGAISTGYTKFRFKHGYAEARMKLPGARGSWSNFWMLDEGWPPELDVMEYPLDNISGSDNHRYRFYTNYHYTGGSTGQWIWRSTDLSSGYNTYAVNWRPGYMGWLFNGSVVREAWNSYFDQPNSFYLIFDYYVGGEWGGQVWANPSTATWPAPTSELVQMKIDWVRIWQRIRDTNLECIGHWRFDETGGTTAADSSGKNMQGTLMGGMSFENDSVDGALGRALKFDGVDDYIALPSGFSEFDNGFSAAFWCYPTAVKAWARFIDLGRGSGSNNIVIARYGTGSDLTVTVYGGSAGGGHVRAINALELNKWQFFAVTISTGGNVRIYKDGTLIQTGSTTWPWGVNRTQNYIGRSNWSGDAFYEGYMDDIRIFDYALIPNEVHDIYTADVPQPYGGMPAPVPGRVLAERFDLGGEGVGYHDTTFGNSGGLFRPDENVDIRAINDFGAGFAVTDIAPDEWLRYTANITETGTYCLYLRAAAADSATPVIIKRTETPVVELPAFEAVGVYDEQVVQTNAVDFSMAYSSNTTWTTGIGQTLGASQILTLDQFKPMVEQAFINGSGGVISFDDLDLPTSFSFDVSFAEGTKKFTVSSLSGTVQTAGPLANRTAVSGNKFLSTDGTPYYYFDFSNFTGMTDSQIVAVGVTLLGRSGSLSTSNWRVSANYTNGAETGSSSTFRTINTGSGNTANDSFSGIIAPDGCWITGIRIHCDQEAYTSIDDLAFVFADSDPLEETIPSPSEVPADAFVVGQIEVTNTGSWDAFQTFVLNDMLLPEGNNQRLTLEFPEGGLDLNWIQIEKQGPWGGSPHTLPGKIQAEEFDVGGPGRAYHDTTVGNTGGRFRPFENVDIVQINDGEPGFAIDDIQNGEWLLYTVNTAAGQTNVHARIASTQAGGQIKVWLDDALLTTIDVPDTGSLTAWQTLAVSGLTLPEATNAALKLEFVGSGFRLNMIQFQMQMPYPGVASQIPGRIEFEHYDIGGPLVAYLDNTDTNAYAAQSQFRVDEAVDVMAMDDNGAGFAVDAEAGEWLQYTCTVQPGVYTILIRSASPFPAQQLTLSRGAQDLAVMTLPDTGEWTVWQNTVLSDVYLPGGADQTLRFTLHSSRAALNYVEFIRHEENIADISGNGTVDLTDFAMLASQWRTAPATPSADIVPLGGDGQVDILDLLMLAENWLSGG